jgi:tetratricopeptide (TPR) repeat protein
MNANGPFDHPTFCYAQGMAFAYPRGRGLAPQYHQAAQQFHRVTELAPKDVDSRLRLAEVFVLGRVPDAALNVVADIHRHADSLSLTHTNLPWLLAIETAAHLSTGDVPGAESVVQTALSPNPNDEDLLSAASRMYMTYACYSNALITIGRQLKIRPDDPNALYGNGLACLQLKLYDRAVTALTRVMQLETNHTSDLHAYALLYRAQAYLGAGNLDDAQRDYESLHKDVPSAVTLYKELAEIALRKSDTNAAIRNFDLYLANIPTNNIAEIKSVRDRLKLLRPPSR